MSAISAKRVAAITWAWADLRARWRSLVALGVLVGAVGGLSAAALAGARRTDTSFERLRDRTNAADAIVFPSQVGVFQADWDALLERPEIAQLARWTLSFGRVAGVEGEGVLFVPADRHWLNDVDRPVVVEGRMFDPSAPYEVVVGEAASGTGADVSGNPLPSFPVGSVIDYKPFGAGQDDRSGEPPAGPDLQLRVVGVVRHVHEFLFVPGMVMPSPAFLDRHGSDLLLVENAMVRLANGAADIPQLQRDVNELVAPGTPINDLHLIQRRVDTTLGVERAALLLLAAAIALGGLMLAIQALGRSVQIPDDEVKVLRAMGFDRAAIALCTVVVHVLVAVLGVVTTLTIAVVASRWFPIGLASRIDPDRGMHADWVALGLATVVVTATVLGYAAAAGWRLTGFKRSQLAVRRSALATRLTPVAPLTVGLGATMALRRGADRSSELVRPVLVGAVVGVLGVVATMTMNRGLDDALANPARAGVAWDATAIPLSSDLTETGINPARLESIGALPQVAGTAVVSRRVSEVNGTGVPIFSLQPGVGEVALTSTAGRTPAGDDEGAIGPRTADQLGVGIGDIISVGSRHQQVRIVGQALFPADVHAGFDEGLWLAPNAFNAMDPPSAPDDPGATGHMIAIRFRPGADPGAALAEVARAQDGSLTDIVPVEVPPELTNLRNVRTLPRLLATFLAVFAAAAVALVLGASVRRRRRDFATLRALGMTRGGTRAILNMQGTAIAVVGLVIGVPLGVALGRIAWRLVTERVPLDFVGPLALAAVLVLAVGALVVVNLLAVLPGRRAAQLRPAEVLRAE